MPDLTRHELQQKHQICVPPVPGINDLSDAFLSGNRDQVGSKAVLRRISSEAKRGGAGQEISRKEDEEEGCEMKRGQTKSILRSLNESEPDRPKNEETDNDDDDHALVEEKYG
ncbi:predicted protein [Nematostella vectensis]|uniref:Uncharacterized protein n=1 Tax=Nematostella vectensis TaxID=45351 RepID=A7SKA0_NEMVE|nr:predicted protein [Nematostella vectensis]|eukprot:XP_001627932.1 predicted protein [Nematostella vectensis]